MKSTGWTAQRALLKVYEAALADVTPEERAMLIDLLQARGREEVERSLRLMRLDSQRMLALPKAQRRRLQNSLGPEGSLVARYATAAWSAKALLFFELLGRSPLDPDYPQKWAGPAALRLVSEYEANTVWLWPWEGRSPFDQEAEVGVDGL